MASQATLHLTEAAFDQTLAQHAEPAYTRDQIPCRFVRGRLT